MTERTGAAPRGARVLGVGAVLAATFGLVLTVQQHAAVIVHQCLPAHGVAGRLGVRLALLRADAACPQGSLGLGGDGRYVLGVTVMVALPALIAHLAGAGLGIGLLRRIGHVIRGAVALVLRALLRCEGRIAHRPSTSRPVPVADRRGPHDDVVGSARWRRGPPAPAFA